MADRRFVNFRRLPRVAEVEAYWHSLCAGGNVPGHGQIRPLDLGPALSQVFVVQHKGAEKMRMRSVGSTVCALLGEPPRALVPTALVAKKDRKAFAGLLRKSIRDPAIVFLSLRGSAQKDMQSAPAVQPAMQMVLLGCGRVGCRPMAFPW